ncbi:permease-like cell division protein FtsX [Olsenella sp. Marseille-QA0557]|uniref:Cell division protein FtsX n=1 Tax=Candidatus Coprovicinus avistercoris TaxID=2840754 RepID=A0A9D1L4F6_9ACTN|nr:ABC transporter permease [Candidatus Coprovicinus avistercoris]
MASNLGYSLREAGHHFRRNLSTALGAVVTIFLSLFIIGLFAIGSIMLNNMVGSVEDQVTIQAFLSDDADQSAVEALQDKISGWDNVQSVTYKSKDEALQEYRETMSNRNAEAAVAALDGVNPVPASLVIQLDDSREVAAVADKLIADSDFQAVADDEDASASVLYGQGTVERLFSVTAYIRIVAIVLVALLVFVAFVFINNTIRLAITARRREIAIERLVGASNSFIRGPFLTEGVLEALFGALLSIGALQLLCSFVLPRFEESLSFLTLTVDTSSLLHIYAALILAGVVIGAFGSFIAMRRYLKV